ncbi:MAG: fumarylacetoacetate hydrolase family protein [Caldimonas sp.]
MAKIVRYRTPQGAAWGVVQGPGILRLAHPDGGSADDIDDLFERARARMNAPPGDEPAVAYSGAELLAPIAPAATIWCVGLNYRAHVAEAGRELPKQPSLFIRRSGSIVGQGAALQWPEVSEQLDFEGELALVIGRGGRFIERADALAHVAAYTCFNDGSVRDFQKHSVTAGKNFEASGACGPWLVSADEVGDPSDLGLVTRVNDVAMQAARTSALIFPIDALIAYVSQFAALRPGDLIATGTPEGVGAGRTPPRWLKRGEEVVVEVERVGSLSNRVA